MSGRRDTTHRQDNIPEFFYLGVGLGSLLSTDINTLGKYSFKFQSNLHTFPKIHLLDNLEQKSVVLNLKTKVCTATGNCQIVLIV